MPQRVHAYVLAVAVLLVGTTTVTAQSPAPAPPLRSGGSANLAPVPSTTDATIAPPLSIDPFSLPQPQATPPQTTPPQPPRQFNNPQSDQLTSLLNSPTRRRLAEIPDMFGDFGFVGPRAAFTDSTTGGTVTGTGIAPLGGIMRGVKVADYNSAIPVDRLYATYHHFHNTGKSFFNIEDPLGPAPIARRRHSQSIDRWMIGGESTFDDGWMSVELRLPIYQTNDFSAQPFAANPVNTQTGELGNLSIILKQMLAIECWGAASWGIGIETPTAAGSHVQIAASRYRFKNDVVRLSPFLATTFNLNDDWFAHGFAQLEIPLGGYAVHYDFRSAPDSLTRHLGEYDDPVSLMLDAGVGYWIVPPSRQQNATWAAIAELHYTYGLEDGDVVGGTTAVLPGASTLILFPDRPNYLNLTLGLVRQTADGWETRVAGSLPLRDERVFSSEIMVQIGRRF